MFYFVSNYYTFNGLEQDRLILLVSVGQESSTGWLSPVLNVSQAKIQVSAGAAFLSGGWIGEGLFPSSLRSSVTRFLVVIADTPALLLAVSQDRSQLLKVALGSLPCGLLHRPSLASILFFQEGYDIIPLRAHLIRPGPPRMLSLWITSESTNWRP